MRVVFVVATLAPMAAAIFAYATRHAAPFVLAVTVLLAVLPLWLFSELLVGFGSEVELWDEGLVVRRRWTEPVVVRFEDVDSVFYDFEVSERMGARTTPTAKVTLTTHDDRRVVVPRGLTEAGEILSALDRHVARPLLAPARQALAAGELLAFGPVVLDGEGVTLDERRLAWTEIDRVEAEPDYVTFHFTDGARQRVHNVAVKDVPHPKILVELLASRVKVESPSGAWGA
jgi:hypothetical protein